MEDSDFRHFLDLIMCSDLWPIQASNSHYLKSDNEYFLKDFADRKAKYLGFKNWIDAYHNFKPDMHGQCWQEIHTLEQKVAELTDLLVSARAIAERKGEGTA